MTKLLLVILFIISVGFLNKSYAQDTIRYVGKLDGYLIYESIELYSDSTFKWTSEYDLSWSEYGKYELTENYLTLSFNETGGNKVKTYISETGRLYLLDKKGRKTKKLKDKSVRTKWSWLKFSKYDYCFYQVN